jgi:hypothetical protein
MLKMRLELLGHCCGRRKKKPRVSGAQVLGGTSNVRTAHAVSIDERQVSPAVALAL